MVGSTGGDGASALTAPPERSTGSRSPAEVRVDGEARYVHYLPAPRQFADAEDRLTFHVFAPAASGQGMQSTPVEVRSRRLGELVIRDGDRVTVIGVREQDGLLAHTIENQTTRTRLETHSGRSVARLLRAPLGVLSFAAIPAFLLALTALVADRTTTALALGVPALLVWACYWALYLRRQG
jgi:hypothetical protein